MAQGLGISPQILIALEERPLDNSVRTQINDVLDLFNPGQCELALRIVRAIYGQGNAKTVPPNPMGNRTP
jgi:hypothetical protein